MMYFLVLSGTGKLEKEHLEITVLCHTQTNRRAVAPLQNLIDKRQRDRQTQVVT